MTVPATLGDLRTHVETLLRAARIMVGTWGCALVCACTFSPDTLPAAPGPLGGACGGDAACASGVCGTASTCVECRQPSTCGAGRTCEGERCVAVVVPPTGPRVHVSGDGVRSTNGTRAHVGRVAVVPVSSSAEVR